MARVKVKRYYDFERESCCEPVKISSISRKHHKLICTTKPEKLLSPIPRWCNHQSPISYIETNFFIYPIWRNCSEKRPIRLYFM